MRVRTSLVSLCEQLIHSTACEAAHSTRVSTAVSFNVIALSDDVPAHAGRQEQTIAAPAAPIKSD